MALSFPIDEKGFENLPQVGVDRLFRMQPEFTFCVQPPTFCVGEKKAEKKSRKKKKKPFLFCGISDS
jgi:hypothetical protein